MRLVTIEEARAELIGKAVEGFTCGCGACHGPSGQVLSVEREEMWFKPPFLDMATGFTIFIGQEGEEYRWSTDMHSRFPELGAKKVAT